MARKLEYNQAAVAGLRKLDRQAQLDILRYMAKRVAKAQTRVRLANRSAIAHLLWRCRSRGYRIIGQLQDQKLVVLVREREPLQLDLRRRKNLQKSQTREGSECVC